MCIDFLFLACMDVCVPCRYLGAQGSQKGAKGHLELELHLWAAMRALGNEPRSSGRAAGERDGSYCWTIFLTLGKPHLTVPLCPTAGNRERLQTFLSIFLQGKVRQEERKLRCSWRWSPLSACCWDFSNSGQQSFSLWPAPNPEVPVDI